jgi:hypothetical protein
MCNGIQRLPGRYTLPPRVHQPDHRALGSGSWTLSLKGSCDIIKADEILSRWRYAERLKPAKGGWIRRDGAGVHGVPC